MSLTRDQRRERWLDAYGWAGDREMSDAEYRRRWRLCSEKFISAEMLIRFGADPGCETFRKYVSEFGNYISYSPTRQNFERAVAAGIYLRELPLLLNESPSLSTHSILGRRFRHSDYAQDSDLVDFFVEAFGAQTPEETELEAALRRIRELEKTCDERLERLRVSDNRIRQLEDDYAERTQQFETASRRYREFEAANDAYADRVRRLLETIKAREARIRKLELENGPAQREAERLSAAVVLLRQAAQRVERGEDLEFVFGLEAEPAGGRRGSVRERPHRGGSGTL